MAIDYADHKTEQMEKALERRLKAVYKDSYEGMCDRWNQYINGYDEFIGTKKVHHSSLKERYDQEYEAYQKGAYTKAEFEAWYQTQIQRGMGYHKMTADMANQMVQANQTASAYINDDAYAVYALNANYQAYQISKDYESISFNIYNEDTVKALATGENHIEFKTTSVDPARDYSWNTSQINKALLSGILQGKSIDRIADSFMTVMKRNRASAIRNARTAYTSAQNGGRQNTAVRAKEMGINSKKQWLAVSDERTRFSHAMLNGQIRDIDKPFSNGLMYPADPSGSPAEVYNCRCKRLYVLPKYENKISNETYTAYENMTPEEQKAERDAYKKWVKEQTNKKSLGNGVYQKSAYDFSNFESGFNDYGGTDFIADFSKLSKDVIEIMAETDPTAQMRKISTFVGKYVSTESKWSGNIIFDNAMKAKGSFDPKTGDIYLRDDASIKNKIHEISHSYAIGVRNTEDQNYYRDKRLEEGSVELLAEEICKANGVGYNESYKNETDFFRRVASYVNISDMEMAQKLMKMPFEKRYNMVDAMDEEENK